MNLSEKMIISSAISQKILIIGQDLNNKGGMSTVLNTYKETFEKFNHIKSTTTLYNNKLKKLFILFGAVTNCIKYCLSSHIKIIHINTASYNDFFRNILFIMIGKVFRKKIILHIHGGDFQEFYERHVKYVEIIIKQCDYIIIVSKFIIDLMKKLNKNVIILPNSIHKPLFEKKPFCKDSDKLRILFLGSIKDEKGIFDLLKMLEMKYESLKDKIELNIGGPGNVQCVRRLENIIDRAKLDNFVTYHGWLNKIEKNKLLSYSDILIQPSYFESFGITVIEAMSYGMPVIASNIGGLPELVENNVNGYLVSPGDLQQIYEAIKKFIENPSLLKKMGEVSYKKVEPYYLENVIKKLNDIYIKALA
jgi:glycosyltransferase involved in cell wall biosynthesis